MTDTAPPTHDPLSDEISAAQAGLASAEAEVSSIQTRVVQGDTSVTAADLLAAEENAEKRRGLVALARSLRKDRDERAAEKARLARIDEWRVFIVQNFGAHEGDVVAKFDAAVAALIPLVEAVQAHNTGRAEVIAGLEALTPLPPDLQVGNHADIRRLRLPGLDIDVAEINLATLCADAVVRAIESAGARLEGQSAQHLHQAATRAAADEPTAALYALDRQADGTWPRVDYSDRLRHIAAAVAGRAL